jgi:hypothetical protein
MDQAGFDHVLKSWTDRGVIPPAWAKDAKPNLRTIIVIGENFEQKIAEARSSNAYTYQGLNELEQRIGNEALKDLTKLEGRVLPELERRLSNAVETLSLASDKRETGIEAVLAFLREAEYRNQLMSTDRATIAGKYLDAAINGNDPLLERTVENAPGMFQLVSKELLAKGKEARQTRVFPDQKEEIEALTQLLTLYHMAINNVKQVLPKTSDSPAPVSRVVA